ncbi:hypothetical protein Kpol_367p9 [Vanderwaltozyma polyspora DSM 70294]|uniref:DNA repair protein REV1 n=1 Tax=Vanderwaltozyma polyspora (strain ATCC 22028 / DSM 70294 / BCRC 21397 / CBS 2163 / NBRC 10782 / NRRL Y-8283 / UCD 57-17) TaxID=436907 RepID=A7TRR0_VANPO|nr:uncharacterized protein Kpol_367p9 [Vanderwaltozyma polyspora DSM 70294]EDO15054.1 hypothetical protein Kpol_367p9 [Vanderwaltozyma polyspora DSM 70294]
MNCDDDKISFLSSLDDDSLIQYVEHISQNGTTTYANDDAGNMDLNKNTNDDDLSKKQNPKRKNYTRGDYFRDKRAKQAKQDKILLNNNKDKLKIFENCTIYINGHTNPDRLKLHELIVIHGGKFLHFLSAKGSATHIVASKLPLKKKLEYANYKVVNPDWIMNSINAGKLLPWQEYSLVSDVNFGQSKLKLKNLEIKNGDTSSVINCNDPSFIENYFKNSRLHHLSTWKSELRSNFVQDLLSSNTRRKIQKEDTLKIFHVDFDCFFATVAALSVTDMAIDINKDAILVCHGSKNSDIASCNYVARNLGIKNGMWVSRAEKLCPKGMKLICLPYNFEQIELKSKIFYNVLKELELFQLILPISIDEAICVISNPDPFIDLNGVCETIRNLVHQETGGCTVSIGCAESLILARLALRLGKPDGYYVVNSNSDIANNVEFWKKFKITDLPGFGNATLNKLDEQFNIKDQNSLYNLQQLVINNDLKNILGNKTSEKLNLALKGLDDNESTKMIYDPDEVFKRKSLSMEINWGIRFENIGQVDVFIDRCAKYLVDKLINMNSKIDQVTLKISRKAKSAPENPLKYMGMGLCDSFSKNSKLGLPTSDIGIIATEVKSLFRMLSCPPTELRGVSIQFNKLIDTNDVDYRLKLPFKKIIVDDTFNKIPEKLKPTIRKELNKREIAIFSSRTGSLQPKKQIDKKFSPTKEEEKFIQELPTQIRKEVIHDLTIIKKAKHSKLDDVKESARKRENNFRQSKFHFQGKDSIFKQISFQGETSFKKISKLVTNWINATLNDAGPHVKDVKLFEKYLIKLANTNRIHMVLSLVELVSNQLNLNSTNETLNVYNNSVETGFQQWEQVLLNRMIPILNKNKHTFQTERKLNIEFNI